MAGFPVGIEWWKYQFFDPTGIYYQGANIIVSAKPPNKASWNDILKVFEPTVFGLIFLSFLSVSFTISEFTRPVFLEFKYIYPHPPSNTRKMLEHIGDLPQ